MLLLSDENSKCTFIPTAVNYVCILFKVIFHFQEILESYWKGQTQMSALPKHMCVLFQDKSVCSFAA